MPQYAALTPAERGVLRLVEGLAYAALIGAASACAQYLAARPGDNPINWSLVAQTCIVGAAVAGLMALAEYFKAHGDPALSAVLAAASQQVALTPGASSAPAAGASASEAATTA
jgi:hypothetical protein